MQDNSSTSAAPLGILTPAEVGASTDPGDTTQRNFRYQHSYAVILFVAAASGAKPYIAIWCEHHEDFLCERTDGKYDGWQIKTATPEDGPWQLTNERLWKSICRFTELLEKFDEHMNDFYFVSNVEHLTVEPDIRDQGRLGRSPIRFLENVDSAKDHTELKEPFATTFEDLRGRCNCAAELLFRTLKRLKLVKGPSRDSFDAEIVQSHLIKLPECQTQQVAKLNAIRDELIQHVYAASSLKSDDPNRHLHSIIGSSATDPYLLAKRLTVVNMLSIVRETTSYPFRYATIGFTISLTQSSGQLAIMEAKMLRGGLAHYVPTMRQLTLSAGANLIELAHIDPDGFVLTSNQLISVVHADCVEAFHNASQTDEPFGPSMLTSVLNRLRQEAHERPEMVANQQPECLIGIAGMLTGECKVWWSLPFALIEQP